MTTLIEIRDANGDVIGRCDARCYNAENPRCECCCGGANHGVGLQQAVENNREELMDNAAEYAVEKMGVSPETYEIEFNAAAQMELFS